MKGLLTYALFAAGAMAGGTSNPKAVSVLEARDSFCGTDQYGIDWWCTDADAICCAGSLTVTCMPSDAGCCTTGLYCLADQTCYLIDGYQYCVYEESGAEVTQTADAASVGQTEAPDGSSRDSSSTSDSSPRETSDRSDGNSSGSSASTARVGMLWALAPLFGAAIAWL